LGEFEMRGRKPTPTHLKVITGNPGRRPFGSGELAGAEPLGNPPADWLPKAKMLWHEVSGQIPPQVATKSDRISFEMLVRLVAKVREQPDELTPALAAQVRAACSEFGMTPSARSRLGTTAVQPDPRDPALDYFTE
jgi:hypothetical protein